jgi:hypothetical protein
MAKSAFADAMARGAANQAGLAVPAGASYDYTTSQFHYADGSLATLSPKPPPAGAPAPSSGSWLPVVAVVGAVGAFWWWRSK